LKSIELEEKINHIQFINQRRPSMNKIGLLSTNDRIIKLWNVKYKEAKEMIRGCEVV
jgi:hypothetical protein